MSNNAEWRTEVSNLSPRRGGGYGGSSKLGGKWKSYSWEFQIKGMQGGQIKRLDRRCLTRGLDAWYSDKNKKSKETDEFHQFQGTGRVGDGVPNSSEFSTQNGARYFA